LFVLFIEPQNLCFFRIQNKIPIFVSGAKIWIFGLAEKIVSKICHNSSLQWDRIM
jgi:hypothetical protein